MISQHSRHAASWRRLHLAQAKLKASSRTSALLSGFAMVALVEVQLDDKMSQGWLISFSICTTLVIVIHLLALMVSTCILPNVEAISNTGHSLTDMKDFGDDSLHDRMHCYIELAWICSTGLGILLFLVQVAILAWVRFELHTRTAAIASTAIILPAIGVFIAFGITFYRRIISHKYEQSTRNIEELEAIASDLDNGTALRGGVHIA
ncbi:Calcium release-activated calcium channel protein 1 [Lamellibrachia satsuma]|nr:Calcium release-activated calcium channel protein 1 [Lamellibrachia satsuma]